MEKNARHGLILGAIVGAALAAFFYFNGGNVIVSAMLIPIGAIMGMAPWFLKPKDL